MYHLVEIPFFCTNIKKPDVVGQYVASGLLANSNILCIIPLFIKLKKN